MLRLSFERSLRKGTYRHNAIVAVHMPCIFCPIKSQPRTGHTRERTRHTTSSSTQPHAKQQPTNAPQTNLTFTRTHHAHTTLHFLFTASQQLFHGPTPRSPLRRLSVRLRRSRSNTSTEYSLPGATQLSQVRSFSPCTPSRVRGWSLSLFAPYCLLGRDCVR